LRWSVGDGAVAVDGSAAAAAVAVVENGVGLLGAGEDVAAEEGNTWWVDRNKTDYIPLVVASSSSSSRRWGQGRVLLQS
jgi:hypothetical protein